MSTTETVWAFFPLVAVLVTLLVFSGKRRNTVDYTDSRAAKESLPSWVKLIEMLNMAVFCFILAAALFGAFELVREPSQSSFKLTGPSIIYVTLGVSGIVLPPAMLCTNLLSWFIPALRRPNENAFRGRQVSFRTANLGLIKFAFISVPLGIVALCVAAVAPWAH